MPKSESFGEIHLDVGASSRGATRGADSGTPFRIIVFGDFSGRASRGEAAIGNQLANREPIRVDRDNVDEVIGRLGVRLQIPVAGTVSIRDLEDFHPDSLYRRLDFFAKLRGALEEVSSSPQATPPAERPPSRPAPDPGLGGLLDQAVEETQSKAESRPSRTKDELRVWLDEKVAPHTEAKADPREAELRAIVHQAVSAQMGALMHYPGFQAIEAAWRGLDRMVREVETGTDLQVYLVDVSRDEIAEDLRAQDDPRETGLYRLLARTSAKVSGGQPWAVAVGHYTFGASDDEVEMLARVGVVAAQLGVPWLSGADARLVGCESLAGSPDSREWNGEISAAWRKLRELPFATSLGLALPRVLQRLPYGKETSPCELFPFEEMGDQPEHDRYLWGNPALLCATLLAQSFTAEGWSMRPNARLTVSGLPLHIYRDGTEPVSQPCAEILMNERSAERIQEQGLMVMASMKDSDSVRLVRFQSIASPPAALAARWKN